MLTKGRVFGGWDGEAKEKEFGWGLGWGREFEQVVSRTVCQ